MTMAHKSEILQVKRLGENAILPTRGSPLSAGYDLSSAEDTVIKAGDKGIVKTDLSIACPEGTYGRIAPRSGLALKKFIDTGAGVVDADYRGPVGVVLFNFGQEDFVVGKGDRIAQLVLEKISMADATKVEELSDTDRGAGGFGSTGVGAKKKRAESPNSAAIETQASSSDALEIKCLSDNAVIPTRGSPLSAGYDLSSAEDTVIKAGGKCLVKTDLSIACPEGTYGRIAPRSGLALKKFIDVGAGVVDADYRGPVGVVLFNFGQEDFVVGKGDRIAQLVLEKISMADATKVDELSDTDRGAGGFGSTGVGAKKQKTDSPHSVAIETQASSSDALEIKCLSDNAVIPTRGSPLSAGYDLSSAEDTVIKAGSKCLVKTDLSIACPEGTYGRIAPRSGLALKKFIDVGAGVVDADYRGPVGVVLFNFGQEDFVVGKGDRIAQLVLEKISMADATEVEELSDTDRGAGGFGSTGVQTDKQ